MPRTRAVKSDARRPQSSAVLERQARRFLELKRGIEQLEYFCKGTVLKRMMKRRAWRSRTALDCGRRASLLAARVRGIVVLTVIVP